MTKTRITLVEIDGSSKIIEFKDILTEKCIRSGHMYKGHVSGEKYLFKYDDNVHKISIDNTNNSDFLVTDGPAPSPTPCPEPCPCENLIYNATPERTQCNKITLNI